MSDFKTSRQALTEMRGEMAKSDQPERDPAACEAFGCPCAATVNVGAGWQCAWHWGQTADCWQAITKSLREHKWLIDHISQMQRMHSRGDAKCASMAMEFWEQQPEQQPNAHEQRNINAYIGRMRNELRHRAGLLARPLKHTVPQREWPEFGVTA